MNIEIRSESEYYCLSEKKKKKIERIPSQNPHPVEPRSTRVASLNIDYSFRLQVLYCDACRESCHPKRGPLAAHNLGPPRGSWQSSGAKGSRGPDGTPVCGDHNGEAVTLYCALCKIAMCALCLRDRHAAHPHDVLPLAAACKAQKVSATPRIVISRRNYLGKISLRSCTPRRAVRPLSSRL